jgi:hypothetical protein
LCQVAFCGNFPVFFHGIAANSLIYLLACKLLLLLPRCGGAENDFTLNKIPTINRGNQAFPGAVAVRRARWRVGTAIAKRNSWRF